MSAKDPVPNSSIVEKGDSITTDIAEKHLKVTIEWSQSLHKKEETYFSGTFKLPQKGGKSAAIFVQEEKLEEFKALATSGTWTVNEVFQFGQAKDRSVRWLVYHDKEHKPYQVISLF
ncbi:hypothetical protein IQ06DRAFT_288370 [Phaeosphaeriaceae sp. SRC1lsM3a]|nr:hypothetical protein IQ06DRAFT_288370 [Stagonospora sp. SRC1lsM3a]